MLKFICFFAVVLLLSQGAYANFPKDNFVYRPHVDIGYKDYLAKSLYGTNQIVLTYDDGPTPGVTEKLLDVLKNYNAKATFFLITARINPTTMPIIKRMLDEGHTIASHTYYHKDVNLEIEEVFRLDLVKSISSIRALTTSLGYPKYETYFRFPGGAYGERDDYHHLNVLRSVSYELFRENCINVVFWDDGVPDYCPGATANQIKDGLLANLFGGSSFTCQLNSDGTAVMTPVEIKSSLGGGVIIMHDTHESVSEATELLLQEVASRNMKVIPLNTVSNFMYTGKGCHW